MLIQVLSEDVRLCSDLATICIDNDFDIKFIEDDFKVNPNADYVILDLDKSFDVMIEKCLEYSKNSFLIFGVMTIPTKSDILNAKEAGCLMVLTKSTFASNLIDIIKKSKSS